MNKYIPVFTYPLASFLVNEGWVIHHTAPNKNDPQKQVYYFNYCPWIYEDMNQFKGSKEDKTMKYITKTIKGEPDYLEPIPKLTIDMYEFTPNNDSAGKMNEG